MLPGLCGCGNCHTLFENTREALNNLGIAAEPAYGENHRLRSHVHARAGRQRKSCRVRESPQSGGNREIAAEIGGGLL